MRVCTTHSASLVLIKIMRAQKSVPDFVASIIAELRRIRAASLYAYVNFMFAGPKRLGVLGQSAV